MVGPWLDFERPLVELEKKIEELRLIAGNGDLALGAELKQLEKRAEKLREDIYRRLTPYQKVQLARHPRRPYALDYISHMAEEFVELHGDRLFRDDTALVGGLAQIGGRRVVVVGQQKGRDTKEKLSRNFGMMHPEGYRKAIRLMKLGAKFGLPVLSLVDTPGAYPGIGAEERGIAGAIARNLREMSVLPAPIVVAVVGEGGSGGALGIAVGDVILMLEHAIYSVISPEGCAAILWRDSGRAPEAAEALKMRAQDLLELGVVDEIVAEPPGGAHRDPEKAALLLKSRVLFHLEELTAIRAEELLEKRAVKFAKMGSFIESTGSEVN
jgi:acetyl-CoA carboxylase carboxyl transferase subunit alpha